MTKNYFDGNPKKEKQKLGPRKETIALLLNYSKALKVDRYKGMQCELILN